MVSRNEIEFEERLMKEKQGKFIEVVDKASKTLKVKAPKIKFWDGECPQGKPNELAHIHTDKNLICISKRRLKQMTMEEIEDVATHEVTHLMEVIHNDNFYVTEDNVRQKIWKPKMVVVTDDNKILVKGGKKSQKDEVGCIVCGETTNLRKCKYCKNDFCEDHNSPKMPLTPNMVFNEKDPILSQLYEKEWRKSGHPCVPYGEWKLNEIKTKEEQLTSKVMEALDRMKEIESKKPFKIENIFPRTSSKKFPFNANKQGNIEKEYKERSPKISEGWVDNSEVKTTKKESRMPIKIIATIILLLIIVYVFFTYNKEIMKFLPMHQNTLIECVANYTKAYESTASFGRDPSAYCKKTCSESYNSTIYRIIEPNQTSKLTICWCDVNNCNA
jgi:predicted nucleic acid binding AN1-type Zn finger protein